MIGDNFVLLLLPYLCPPTGYQMNITTHTCPFCGNANMKVFLPFQSWNCQVCNPMSRDLSGGGKAEIYAHALLFWSKGLGCTIDELEEVLKQELAEMST